MPVTIQRWTGLALSGADGAWRSHSWVTTGRGALVETTISRTLYFGLPAAFDPAFDDDFEAADRVRLRSRFGLHCWAPAEAAAYLRSSRPQNEQALLESTP